MALSVLRVCLENSTAHGISHAARGQTILQRVFWILLFLAASSAFIYYFCENLSKYYDQPTSVTMKMYGTTFVAPDVHICNLLPLAKSRLSDPWTLQNSSDMRSLLNDLEQLESLIQNTGLSDEAKTLFLFTSVQPAKLFRAAGHLKNQTLLVKRFASSNTIEEDEVQVEHNLFYFSCFRLSLGNESEFLSTSNHLLLLFYTDNYQMNSIQGPKFANYLLTTQEYVFLPSIYQVNGISLIFTPPGEYPHPESHSVIIKPGHQTFIKLKMQKTIGANTRRNPCQSQPITIDYYNPLYGGNTTTRYVKSLVDCKFRKIIEKLLKNDSNCQCIPFMVPTSLDMTEKYPVCANVSAATTTEEFSRALQQTSCSRKYWSYDTTFNITECESEKPCETLQYFSDVASVEWPAETDIDNVAATAFQPLVADIGDAPGLMAYLRLIQMNSSTKIISAKSNFACVRLSAGQTNSLLVEESISYGIDNLVSDIGGVSGLYLGGSFLTIFEIFDLIHHYVYISIAKRRSKGPET